MEAIHADDGMTEAARSIVTELDARLDVVITDTVIPAQVAYRRAASA
jgi:hypothetical protein